METNRKRLTKEEIKKIKKLNVEKMKSVNNRSIVLKNV